MLVLLFLFALFRILQGAPLAADNANNGGSIADIFPAAHILTPRAEVVFGTRNTSDIITSCLATIFACTWTALHPNIPSPADSRWRIFKRRLVTMIYALLAPEFISLWAFRQYIGAKDIIKEYNKDIAENDHPYRGQRPWYRNAWEGFREWLLDPPPLFPYRKGKIQPWTMTHGFFVQMGGFVLSRNGTPIQAVSFSKSWVENDRDLSIYMNTHQDQPRPSNGIKELILASVIDAPRITEVAIEDRSKGDIISKVVIILQTTWFISQCIARWSIRLPVTELEIVTLAFAMLNGATYALWWHKPQNVGVPVYLEIKHEATSSNSLNNEPVAPSTSGTHSAIEVHQIYREATFDSILTENLYHHSAAKKLPDAKLLKQSFFGRKLKKDWDSSDTRIQLLFSICKHLILSVLHPLQKLRDTNSDYVRDGDLRVPMFSAEIKDLEIMRNAAIHFLAIVATLFGCVHLVPAFFLHYLSRTEMWFWRISAAFITILPLISLLYAYMQSYLLPSRSEGMLWVPQVAAMALPLYLIARLVLIILAFLSLRGGSESGVYVTIDWISSIPHL